MNHARMSPMSRLKYRHVQIGWASIIAIGVGFAVMIGVFMSLQRVQISTGMYALAALFFGLLYGVFGRLTTEVDEHEFRARFGFLGWPQKSAPLAEIAGVLPTRLSPFSGWGIRITTRGLLFNVSGPGAVIVGLHTGKQFLVGTDEPEALADAINFSLGRTPLFTMIRGAGVIPD
jgi:hypothetical protein